MSVFGLTTYASIDEAWGTSSFAPAIENAYKTPGVQSSVLAAAESVTKESEDAVCIRYINSLYKREGLVGVRRVLDPVIIRELQTQAIRKYASSTVSNTAMILGPDELLFVMLALLSIVFAIDS